MILIKYSELEPGRKVTIDNVDDVLVAIAPDSALCASGTIICSANLPNQLVIGELAVPGTYPVADGVWEMVRDVLEESSNPYDIRHVDLSYLHS